MAQRRQEALTPKQEQALIALLSQPTIKQAADACGLGERTLHTWLEQPAFGAAYRKARRESFSHAISLTQRYAALAVNTLAKLLADPACGHAAKVSAATALLKFSRESIELDDLSSRVDALERASAGERGPGTWRPRLTTGGE